MSTSFISYANLPKSPNEFVKKDNLNDESSVPVLTKVLMESAIPEEGKAL